MRSKYFTIEEFVSPEVYKKYGSRAWQFIDDRLIETMDTIREYFGKPVVINDWLWGGDLKQRGLRANKDPLVANKKDYYISQHCLGKAVDFHVKYYTIEYVYNEIKAHPEVFKHIRRIESIEDAKTWVHIDLANTETKGIYTFRA